MDEQAFIEGLLCSRRCFWCWGLSGEQGGQGPCVLVAHSQEETNKHTLIMKCDKCCEGKGQGVDRRLLSRT